MPPNARYAASRCAGASRPKAISGGAPPSRIAKARDRHEKKGEKGDLVDRADRVISGVNKVNITGYAVKDLGGNPEEIHKAFTGFQKYLYQQTDAA